MSSGGRRGKVGGYEGVRDLGFFGRFILCIHKRYNCRLRAHIRKSHPTRIIQYIITHLGVAFPSPPPREEAALCVPITNLLVSLPEIPKPAFVCNLLCVYKRTCISIYKYPFYYFCFSPPPYLQSTRGARFNAEATWTGRGPEGRRLATPEDPPHPDGPPCRDLKKYVAYLQRKAWTR